MESSDKLVNCPFFKSRSPLAIGCEGILDKSITYSSFRRATDKQRHVQCYCNDQYTKCPIYILNDKKYDEFGDRK